MKDDNHHNQLLYLLGRLQFKDKVKALNVILTENAAKNTKKKHSSSSKGIYVEGSKYEFNVEITIRSGYNSYNAKNGTLYMSIFGQNENKLVSNYRFNIKKWRNPTLKFEFSSIDFLKKIGNLTKVYFKNDCKELWQVDRVNINVYQTNVKHKKNRGPSILAKQYEKKLKGASVKGYSSLFVDLS